ncbi:MAG: ImmA/IrrE family metallo-endopeptidase [Propionibacteriaceae bacterium]|jgi:hypothetical protein|nr:ImmA/IrrE family metallo-endopeptidase [Propionibacteriaceae bacterium]
MNAITDRMDEMSQAVELTPDRSPLTPYADSDPDGYAAKELALHVKARDLADITRQEYGKSDIFPPDPTAIAHALGLPVTQRGLNPAEADPDQADWVSGVLRKLPGSPVGEIFVEWRDCRERQRFTVAHELWHWRQRTLGLHQASIDKMEFWDVREPNQHSSLDEYQADLFAHKLLMPTAAVRTELILGHSTAAMAKRFNVTQRTMENRLRQLALIQI